MLLLLILPGCFDDGLPDSIAAIPATSFNGTWAKPGAELMVWALDEQRLQVELHVYYEYDTPQGPMANVGSAAGIALLAGGTVALRPEEGASDCTFLMWRTGDGLQLREAGACGLGLNVTADGRYERLSRSRPEVGEP